MAAMTPGAMHFARLYPRLLSLACASVQLLLPGGAHAASPPPGTNVPPANTSKPDYGTPAEKALCATNLSRIYAAIQAYRKDKNDLPEWLSDMVPNYLDDINVLTCPVSRRTGKIDNQGLADPNLAISYAYQFGNQPIPQSFGGGSKRTMREWKRRQVALVGDIVPLVRCRHHLPQLNVSFGGKVFESPPGWESMMTNGFSPANLTVQKLFPEDPPPTAINPGATNSARITTNRPANPPAPVIIRIPPRDSQTPAALIDLSGVYNAGLDEAWHTQPGSSYKHSNLAWLPKGIQTFAGVEFDVRGVIQLAGRGLGGNRFPPAVKGIKLTRKCRSVHFLHATGWSVPDGTRIGHFRVVYDDGEDREIPIIYGVDVRDWTVPTTKTEPAAPDLVVAWTGKSPTSQSLGTTLRLFKSTWENSRPQTRIDTMDYVSARTNCAPFLISITTE